MSRQGIVLSIDQGTTGTRAILYQSGAKAIATAYSEFKQYYPKPGWVEHDAAEIWQTTQRVIGQALKKARISFRQIQSIGITNQRETVVMWDKSTGKPVLPAIVWQDRRTTDLCNQLKKRGLEKKIRRKTGLVIDPYFSGSKVRWILEKYPKIRKKASQGKILFGTIDTWLVWKLTGGKSHVTDVTNASRTLLYNIKTQKWDSELLKTFKVPKAMLPKVQASGSLFGKTASGRVIEAGVPIQAIMGDQQAALYGQACYRAGQVKNTYGTGCFIVMNAGKKVPKIPHGLLLTLACDQKGQPVYALEGSIFIAGAAIQWLRDGLQFFKKASETDRLIRNLKDNGGVTVVPAFAGLGSPYWKPEARGMISGLTRGTTRAHIIRATLESLAQQSSDVVEQMKKDSGIQIRELRVDGGATANQFLMQHQSDLLQIPILVSDIAESTAWGVAKLAAKVGKVWENLEKIDKQRKYKRYRPKLKKRDVRELREVWKREVSRLL